MPARPGHPHSEDIPRLEVPQPVLAAEKEPDSGGSMVPSICGETSLQAELDMHGHELTQ